jgi:hypothetical protein
LNLTNSIEQNGDGNPKLVGFSSNKEVKVNLSSAIFDNRVMALLTGNSATTAASTVYRREIITVTSSAATLTNVPKDGTIIGGLWLLPSDGVESTEYTNVAATPAATEFTLSTKTLGFNAAVVDNTQFVAYYIADTANTTQTITISSNTFPAAFKLVLEVLVTDFYSKALYPAQITIPSCKMEDNWQLSFKPDGDPEPLTLPIEVLKPATSDDMFTLKIYDSDSLT